MKNLMLFVFASLLVLSCGSDEEPMDTNDCSHTAGTLNGNVLGEPFDLKQGTASLDPVEEEYQVFLFGQDEVDFGNNPCALNGLDFIGTQLTFFVGDAPESQDLGATRLVTLFNATSQAFEISAMGCFELTEVTQTTLSGKLTLNDPNSTNEVSGNWTATICE